MFTIVLARMADDQTKQLPIKVSLKRVGSSFQAIAPQPQEQAAPSANPLPKPVVSSTEAQPPPAKKRALTVEDVMRTTDADLDAVIKKHSAGELIKALYTFRTLAMDQLKVAHYHLKMLNLQTTSMHKRLQEVTAMMMQSQKDSRMELQETRKKLQDSYKISQKANKCIIDLQKQLNTAYATQQDLRDTHVKEIRSLQQQLVESQQDRVKLLEEVHELRLQFKTYQNQLDLI